MLEKHFRTAPSAGFPTDVFVAETNPIIVIDPKGLTTYYNKIVDKQFALEEQKPEHTILFVWQGKMKSDVFEVTSEIGKIMLDKIITKYL